MKKYITIIATALLLSACVAGGESAWKNVEYQYNVQPQQPNVVPGNNPLISLYR